MTSRQNRFEYVESIFRLLPGALGFSLRALLLRNYFASFGRTVVIWPGTRFRFPWNIQLGNNVSISYDSILQGGGGISVGDNTLVGPGTKIWSVNHVFNDSGQTINVQGYEGRSVSIGNDCWIGSHSFIKPGSNLPDGCVLLPGTVLGRLRIPQYSVVSGNPGRVIGPRARVGAMLGWGTVDRTS